MKTRLICFILFFSPFLYSQDKSELDNIVREFDNSSHHWYDIKDTDKIILPDTHQIRYEVTDYINIADNILLFQKSNGGWPKNYDMRAKLTTEQREKVSASKEQLNTCFDNSTTYSHINYLSAVYNIAKDEKYKKSILSGIRFILNSQYVNGGWPQFFPDTSGYRKYITYNDGAMIGIMRLFKKILENNSVFSFIEDELREKILFSYNKGIECILNTQIKINDTLYVWCQQHDNITFLPQNARTFEPAAICNGESADIVDFLMSIKNPSVRIINAIESAVHWFKVSKIYGVRIQTIEAPYVEYQYRNVDSDKVIVVDENADPIWTRYYDLITRKPIFCNRDGHIVDTFEEVERERRVGYAWYVYDPQKVLDEYSSWLSELNEK